MEMGELARLHLTASLTDIILMLAAVFVAAFWLPVVLVGYLILASMIIGIVDYAYRMRKSVAYVIGARMGSQQSEVKDLRMRLADAKGQQEISGEVVGKLASRIVESRGIAPVTQNYVPYDPAGGYQECIADALLIFDTAMVGNNCSRESMTPSIMSQDRWDTGKEWLVGAKVLIYRSKKTRVWAVTDRRVAKAMLTIYASEHTSALS
jgi:hypothetical protein